MKARIAFGEKMDCHLMWVTFWLPVVLFLAAMALSRLFGGFLRGSIFRVFAATLRAGRIPGRPADTRQPERSQILLKKPALHTN